MLGEGWERSDEIKIWKITRGKGQKEYIALKRYIEEEIYQEPLFFSAALPKFLTSQKKTGVPVPLCNWTLPFPQIKIT